MSKHTPGPWTAYDHGVQELCVYSEADEKCIAVLDGEANWSWHEPDQRLTNAHLIAASPELYEALKDIAKQRLPHEATEDERTDADYESGYEACVRVARAAIAKAEGQP